jgi:radical SAM superfamily enzyme YgiQ (UPF0313 family)
LEDLRLIAHHKYVFFVDDNVAADRNWAMKLFEALIDLKICWSAQVNLNLAMDKELLSLAARSGFQMAVTGIETTCSDSLAEVHKNRLNKPVFYYEAVRNFRRAGVITLAGMIFGFDNDTEETFDKNMRFLIETKIPMASVYVLTPFPRTPLYERLKAEGRLITEDWSRYDSYSITFALKNFSPERFTELYWNFCTRLTTWRNTIRRFWPPPKPRYRTFWRDVLAIGLVFLNNLILFHRDAKRRIPPLV